MNSWNSSAISAVCIGLLLSLPCGTRAQQAGGLLPPGVSSAIEKAIPGATVVTLEDIDAKACSPVPSSPGIVQGDFNGDNHPGFAVLLRAGETGKIVDWQGRKLKEIRYAFAIFLSDGKSGFQTKLVRRFIDFAPLGAFIDLKAPGKVRNRDENRDVVIRNPAVILVFCEKSASVYYISHNHVRTVPIAD